MPMFEFQVVAETEKEAQQFMEAVQADNVNIEEWEYNMGRPTEKHECYGFGFTDYSPKQLNQIADERGVVLAYVKNVEKVEQEADELMKRVMQTAANFKAMNVTSEQDNCDD
jgi:uncharacterized protein Yka (UPF0111/DUF47 family)